MAGPAQQTPLSLVVPPGEAQVLYSPSALSQEVRNFKVTDEGTVKTITGPCPYEVDRGSGYQKLGTPHGLFHAGLLGGVADMLLLRAGTQLYRHAGWNRNWESILTGLDNDDRPGYPDQFVVLSDKIIWTNGVDRAQVITHDGMVTPLGFDVAPGAPTVLSPGVVPSEYRSTSYANSTGYSWPGRIGTIGDVLDGQHGSILAGTWYYFIQYEDIHGNLSPLSAASNSAAIATIQADPFWNAEGTGFLSGGDDDATITEGIPDDGQGTELDDLARQFMVQLGGTGPDHTVAMRVYRTPDARHVGTEPRLLIRVGGNEQLSVPDAMADSELGPKGIQMAAVPVFQTMCTHQGCLIIANTPGDPGIVRRSQVGFPGTFPETDWVYPDSGGSEVTAVTSHGGVLLAFTESSVYSLEVFDSPRPLAQGIGCVAPRSIKAMPDGTLIWLGRDGFYGMRGMQIMRLSGPIDRTVRNYINRGRVRLAVATLDWASGEYRCAVAPAGESQQRFIFCFDGQHWRRQQLGIDIRDMCTTDDWRLYTLIAGRELSSVEDKREWEPPGDDVGAGDPPEEGQSQEDTFGFDSDLGVGATLDPDGPSQSESDGQDLTSTDTVEPDNTASTNANYDPTSTLPWDPTDVDVTLAQPDNDPSNKTGNNPHVPKGPSKTPDPYLNLVYVMDHEIDAYTPPERKYVYRSGWMRGDDVGLTPIHVRTIFLGLLDAHNSNFTIRLYRNGSWKSAVKVVDVLAVGPDDGSAVVTDAVGSAVVGIARVHDPRLFWRQVPVGLENSFSWAFEIEATPPTRLHLAAFSFDISVATSGSARGRIPHRADV